MAEATALRHLDKLFGKAYKAGETIPADVISQITPQALAALVANRHIDVPGMEPASSAGASQHMKARLDKQDETIRKLTSDNAVLMQANDDMAKRMSVIETALAAGAGTPKSKREARKAGAQE